VPGSSGPGIRVVLGGNPGAMASSTQELTREVGTREEREEEKAPSHPEEKPETENERDRSVNRQKPGPGEPGSPGPKMPKRKVHEEHEHHDCPEVCR
jgi:hypothetical protein